MTLDERVSRLEGIIEQIERRLDGLENRTSSIGNRLNVQLQVAVRMWVTTMVGIVATLAAVLLRT